jgi:hypothetical protein
MNNFYYSEHEAAQRRQTLLREAAMERSVQQLPGETEDTFGVKHFWYEALTLPIPFYDEHANIAQTLSSDTMRRRTRSFALMVSSASFGLGMLLGGWLKLEVVLISGCIAVLVACVPVVKRSIVLLKRWVLKAAFSPTKKEPSVWS